jgi:hypothetical protein
VRILFGRIRLDLVCFVTKVDGHCGNIARVLFQTHFKTYNSPLAGFTSPNLQPPTATDRQLPTIYWVSSAAGQSQDVNRQLCQYEFPSGACKDQTCTDIHARDLSASGEYFVTAVHLISYRVASTHGFAIRADDDVRKIAAPMFPNAGPQGLASIVERVQQSTEAEP